MIVQQDMNITPGEARAMGRSVMITAKRKESTGGETGSGVMKCQSGGHQHQCAPWVG